MQGAIISSSADRFYLIRSSQPLQPARFVRYRPVVCANAGHLGTEVPCSFAGLVPAQWVEKRIQFLWPVNLLMHGTQD